MLNKNVMWFLVFSTLLSGCHRQAPYEAPPSMIGSFVDDYGIEYTITDKTWEMGSSFKLNILEWNADEQFLIGQNHADNIEHAGRFTRIDFMSFAEEMQPYRWGFCISTFDAPNRQAACLVEIANRESPKTGCNGHPFSRMKPVD